MLINALFLSISSSMDSLGIGITYGIKNTKISYMGKIVLFFISFTISILSIWFGNSLKSIFSDSSTNLIGSSILIFMGIFICFQSLKKEKNSSKYFNSNDNNLINNHFYNKKNNCNSNEKIYSFFIDFLGITIKIIKNPVSSDFDDSKSIDSKEAIFLGFALSLDSFCIGVGGSIIGINSILFPIFIAFFQLNFISLGNLLGRKLNKLSHLPDNMWSVISGFLLIVIGIARFLLK